MTTISRAFGPGAMVRARGREWIVLPSDDPLVLRVRPLGGTDEDASGFYLPLEGGDVTSATLPPPDPEYAAGAVSAALLRDAVRLGFRSAAGPLRSIARIAVEPRPYQLVPLLMALRLNPVRLLIGDDVGVGKTIEAAMIARELLDRGEIKRLCVLCPPHLCEQWRRELTEKFHLPAVEVRPGTVTALGRHLPLDRSIFQEYPITVVSIDFIKSDRRRAQFVQTCPDFVIVDEAHAAAQASSGGSAQQQRHSLLRELAVDGARHMVLVTATPHSGDEGAFASLIGLLAPELQQQVAQLQYQAGTAARQRLARHFVQRRRSDIDHYLQDATIFPKRETLEQPYQLSNDYKRLLEATRRYTHELVRAGEGLSHYHQRVRWWAALALLRCVSSSPAAAAVALRTRAASGDNQSVEQADRLGETTVFDLMASDEAEGDDSIPAADTTEGDPTSPEHRRLLELARQAEALQGRADPKLATVERLVRELLDDGFSPIIFCRYIATAQYVGEELERRLRGAEIRVVTGDLPPEDRTSRVESLSGKPRHVLVATDCLSEGINLQQYFNAVIHYDLAWNPTRHEQREGRVDRYAQPSPRVRTALVYGQDNEVDGVVLRVLLRKAEKIRQDLGVSVSVPVDTNAVLQAILEALILRPSAPVQQLSLFQSAEEEMVDRAWAAAKDREQRTRTVFAQHALHPDEVAAELNASAKAVGTSADVERFVTDACDRLGARLSKNGHGLELPIHLLPRQVLARADMAPNGRPLLVGFTLPVSDGVTHLARTHPLVEALSSFLLDTSLATPGTAVARRCGAMRTTAVSERTVLFLLRARFLIEETRAGQTFTMLAEECFQTAFQGDPDAPTWLPSESADQLAHAQPAANVLDGQARLWLRQILDPAVATHYFPPLLELANARARELQEAHRRVRAAANIRNVRQEVKPHHEVDLLGAYVLMPHVRG